MASASKEAQFALNQAKSPRAYLIATVPLSQARYVTNGITQKFKLLAAAIDRTQCRCNFSCHTASSSNNNSFPPHHALFFP